MAKKKMTRRDRRQTKRADRERAVSGMTRPYAETSGPMGRSHRVSTSADKVPIKLGAAKGRDIPLPPSK